MTESPEIFGSMPDGTPVHRWWLDDGTLAIAVLDLGATVQSLLVPDASGHRDDVTLGFDNPAGYLAVPGPYAGSVVGRIANRIDGGAFQLDGVRYRVPPNEGGHALHGGPDGYDRRLWQVAPAGEGALSCRLVSPAGDQGFPGRLEIEVRYSLPGDARVVIEYRIVTDAPTVVNLTQHAYFALDGLDASTRDHVLQVHADRYTPTRPDNLPTGEIAAVEGTRFDLRTPLPVNRAGSIDHNFVVGEVTAAVKPMAVLSGPRSGRRLEVRSTEPAVQVFTATELVGDWTGKGGRPIRPSAGIALETQHFPDSPNQPGFPSTRLDPGRPFTSRTEWVFR